MEATTSITLAEIINLSQGLATLNLGYLGLCVTIILFAGGFFYLFNFKPLQDSIKKQEDQLATLKEEIRQEVEVIKTGFSTLVSTQTTELKANIDYVTNEADNIKKDAFEKIDKAEEKLSAFTTKSEVEFKNLKKEIQFSILDALWKEQYMWRGNEVYTNALDVLLEFMEKTLEYGIHIATDELWLTCVEDTLKEIKKYEDGDKNNAHTRLLVLLDKIKGKEIAIKKLKTIVGKVFE